MTSRSTAGSSPGRTRPSQSLRTAPTTDTQRIRSRRPIAHSIRRWGAAFRRVPASRVGRLFRPRQSFASTSLVGATTSLYARKCRENARTGDPVHAQSPRGAPRILLVQSPFDRAEVMLAFSCRVLSDVDEPELDWSLRDGDVSDDQARSDRSGRTHGAGVTFWLRRKTLCGSNLAFSARSRAKRSP